MLQRKKATFQEVAQAAKATLQARVGEHKGSRELVQVREGPATPVSHSWGTFELRPSGRLLDPL